MRVEVGAYISHQFEVEDTPDWKEKAKELMEDYVYSGDCPSNLISYATRKVTDE